MTTPPKDAPVTEAGQDMLAHWATDEDILWPEHDLRERILAIEAEAATAARSDGIDAAWAEAEAALPEGWRVGEIKNTAYRGDGERWLVMAWEFGDAPDYRVFESAYADTPADALRALAARLRSEDTT